MKEDIIPGFNASGQPPNYYGFVTGGATPAAALADNVVTAYDQNVQVHLPNGTVATDVEDRALTLLCELLDLHPTQWPHRTFTTGATASNIIGLACAREHIITRAAERASSSGISIGEHELLEATRLAGIDNTQIFITVPRSSLGKAASLIGLERTAIKLVSLEDAPHRFSMHKLRKALERPRTASVVAISCAEVNTGRFATIGYHEMQDIRNLCDQHSAWIHVDGGERDFRLFLDFGFHSRPAWIEICRARFAQYSKTITISEESLVISACAYSFLQEIANLGKAFGLFARILTNPEFRDVAHFDHRRRP